MGFDVYFATCLVFSSVLAFKSRNSDAPVVLPLGASRYGANFLFACDKTLLHVSKNTASLADSWWLWTQNWRWLMIDDWLLIVVLRTLNRWVLYICAYVWLSRAAADSSAIRGTISGREATTMKDEWKKGKEGRMEGKGKCDFQIRIFRRGSNGRNAFLHAHAFGGYGWSTTGQQQKNATDHTGLGGDVAIDPDRKDDWQFQVSRGKWKKIC